jgi:hypothetical protein
MKEGLLGGVWSLGWPLLDIERRNPSLKYMSAKVDGRELHEIDYNPKGGMNNINVKLFFEPDTFRHEDKLPVECKANKRCRSAKRLPGEFSSANLGWATGGPITEMPASRTRSEIIFICSWKFTTSEVKFNDAAAAKPRPHLAAQLFS